MLGVRGNATDPGFSSLPGGNSVLEPPDPIPNSEVKRLSADDSVGFPCESRSLPGFNLRNPESFGLGIFYWVKGAYFIVYFAGESDRLRIPNFGTLFKNLIK